MNIISRRFIQEATREPGSPMLETFCHLSAKLRIRQWSVAHYT